MDSKEKILSKLKDTPGLISSEIGVPNTVFFDLENEGKIVRIGLRKTGRRGRPPIEWALSGEVVDGVEIESTARHPKVTQTIRDERIKRSIERVLKWNAWSKAHAEIYRQYEYGIATKEDVSSLVRSIPPIPTSNDYRVYEASGTQ